MLTLTQPADLGSMGEGASPSAAALAASPECELTVVMPCLNEADTIEICVSKALRAIETAGIDAEVLVADNGSTDGSQRLAESLGARVVNVKAKGYGSALMGGIAAARGRYVCVFRRIVITDSAAS